MIASEIYNTTKSRNKENNSYSQKMRKSKQSNTIYIKKNDEYVVPDVDCDITYEQYLKTSKWYKLKQQRLDIDLNTCQQCGCYVEYKTSACHHITYRHLFNENVYTELTTVCHDCHDSIHNWHGKDAKYYPLINADFAYKRPLWMNLITITLYLKGKMEDGIKQQTQLL